jgi:hypothetical protein
MLNKDHGRNDAYAQARQEEARLLGARDYKDKNAVPITPGASLQKNRKAPGVCFPVIFTLFVFTLT